MQLGIRLHDTAKCPFEERIADVHRMGFACGQLALSKLIDEFPTTDETLTPGLAMYIKNVFARNQVDIAVLGCYLNLADPDKGQLAETIRHYLAHIRFASWLGCGMVGTETGTPNESYSYTPECHTEAALLTFMENLRPVVAYAEKMGVVIGIEPVCRHIVGTPKRARRVLDEIASPNLQIIFDPVNLLDAGNYREKDSIKRAINECIRQGILSDYLKRKGSEVTNMLIAEYSYEEDIQVKQQEAMQKGWKEGRGEGLVLSAQIFRALQSNPDFTDAQIAVMVGCDLDDVESTRKAFGL